MEEVKELGLKAAKDQEEVFWIELKEKCEKMIADCKHEIKIQEHLIKLCDSHIDTAKKEVKDDGKN